MRIRTYACVAALLCCAGGAVGQASFRLLVPDEGFDYSVVQDVSADGTKVLVSLQNSVPRPTTPFSYVLDLRDDSRMDIVDPTGRIINGLAINGDGTVVAGSIGGGPLAASSAFVWYAADNELLEIWGLQSGNLNYAMGISADGSVVVGTSGTNFGDPYQQGWRWTRAGGFVPLHCLGEPDVIFSGVSRVSDDGSTVVGYGSELIIYDPEEPGEVNYPRGSVWPDGGTVPIELPPMPNPFNGGVEGRAASADGSVVVGFGAAFNSNGGFANHAFRWTADTGVVDLGDIPGLPTASIYAMDCTADGNTIVGYYNSGGVSTWDAFIWTQDEGIRSLRQVLTDAGAVIPENIRFRETYTSNDGRVIAGWAYDIGENRYYGYVATLPDDAGSCPADWDGDDAINSNDISAFLAAWLDSVQNGNLDADFDQSGSINSNDISAFLTAWLDAVANGC